MRSTGRRFVVASDFRTEALGRARVGRPISAVLRQARAILEDRGWIPRRSTEFQSRSDGALDVLGAVTVAARDQMGVRLKVIDYYVLLAPIAAVVQSSFARWESQSGLHLTAVLTMMDAAIAFAVDAEQLDTQPPGRDRRRVSAAILN